MLPNQCTKYKALLKEQRTLNATTISMQNRCAVQVSQLMLNDARASNYTYVIHSSPLFLCLFLGRNDFESRSSFLLGWSLLGNLAPSTTGFLPSARYRFNNTLVRELLATKVLFSEVATIHQLRVTIHAVCDDASFRREVREHAYEIIHYEND